MRVKRTRYTQLRLDQRTLDMWWEAAERSGMTLSEWIRARCNGGANEAAVPRRRAA